LIDALALRFPGAETVGREEQLANSREETAQHLDGHLREIPDAVNVLSVLSVLTIPAVVTIVNVFHGIRFLTCPAASGNGTIVPLHGGRRTIARGGVSHQDPSTAMLPHQRR
jgi:hypothetical protein